MNFPKIPWLATFNLTLFFFGKHLYDVSSNLLFDTSYWIKLLVSIVIYLILAIIIIWINKNFHFKYPNSYISSFYFVSTIILQLYFGVNKTEKWQIEFMLFALINLGIMSLFLKKGNIESN